MSQPQLVPVTSKVADVARADEEPVRQSLDERSLPADDPDTGAMHWCTSTWTH